VVPEQLPGTKTPQTLMWVQNVIIYWEVIVANSVFADTVFADIHPLISVVIKSKN
jgi:hypothetical protein